MSKGEIYIEIHPVGKALEIVALDAETATEVRFIAPDSAGEDEIKALASSKMTYVLGKAAEAPEDKRPPGRGIIV